MKIIRYSAEGLSRQKGVVITNATPATLGFP